MATIDCNGDKKAGKQRILNLADGERVIARPDSALVQRVAEFSTATLGEAAGKPIGLPVAIKPISPSMRACGPVVTVTSPARDNLTLHQAIYVANPGDMLVVEVSGLYEAGYWGDIMTHAALHRKIAGLVIDGCVRDSDAIEEAGFPVFCRGLCMRGTAKRGKGRINQPITIGEVSIRPGDLVVGDRDGVVVIPQSEVPDVLAEAGKRDQKENRIKDELAAGKTTLEIYGW